ncbi:MAG: ATP-binding cassette domain-containing protein [Bacteroidetes bacterium]|nr:ATP-binding cassette domain-containing protein [Bacteroidota bacterium]MBK9673390.1 ATP-binding cassette domain-containing protein [Bacteroidota bacterium]MBK9800598.1 ATP-binding cassette domain-containing protein [Bacteroidota bacterium]MBP6411961.1 ATP-binding cassette domain-containing protein [Bacteroidia bacterium]
MIEVKNINKEFAHKKVLKNISIKFEQGKANLIIGESGSGKTVLIKTMVGLFSPDEGQILFDNRDFTSMNYKEKKEIRKEIGMLFQGGALFDSQTVEENVIFPLSMFSEMSESEKRDRANFCLQRVNLINANKLYPAEISGGMKKRVAIARAIAMNPKYLFCDEPNSGLDPRTSILIDTLIKEITEEFGITTIVITHDMNSVMEIGDNISFIYKGEKWWEGNKSEVLKSDNKELNDFVYASKFMKRIKAGL